MRDGYPKTLNEQIDGYESEQITLFDITHDNATICDGTTVTNYMKFMYGEYKTTDPLYLLWINYNHLHGADFSKAYTAWISTYNPIENYNADETNVYLTNDGQETTTISHGKTTTITANDVQNDTYVTTDESESPRLENRQKQTGNTTDAETGTTTTTVDRTTKNLTVDNVTYSADNVHGEIKKRHGNIGVTTTQQMLQSEIDLRFNPIVQLYIDTFISDYAYYVG